MLSRRHPEVSRQRQRAFKKNSPGSSPKSSGQESRPVRLMFQDEARFGRITAGLHKVCDPVVPVQIVREYTYLLGHQPP